MTEPTAIDQTTHYGEIHLMLHQFGTFVTDGEKSYEVDGMDIKVNPGVPAKTVLDLPKANIWIEYDLAVIDDQCERTGEKVRLAWYQIKSV